ncbi:MAG: hypothetical protein CL608_04475 [Anaerolineaceae bacterium]|nr:hypothetical protein [Anaerolineaceae bacterium]
MQELIDFLQQNDTLFAAVITLVVTGLIGILGKLVEFGRYVYESRQQNKIRREERAAVEKDNVLKIYIGCVHYLSLLAVQYDENQLENKKTENLQKAQEYLAKLSLHLVSSGKMTDVFSARLHDFIRGPFNTTTTFSLRDVVIKLAANEQIFLPDLVNEDLELEFEKKQPLELKIRLDKNFMKAQFEKGVSLKANHTIPYSLSQLSESQRRRVWEIFDDEPPIQMELKLPILRNGNIVPGGNVWMASIDPTAHQIEEIFLAWEKEVEMREKDFNLQMEK